MNEFERHLERKVLTEREIKILDMRESGMTLDAIGVKYGVTRERIRQIIAKAKKKLNITNNKKGKYYATAK